uniref:Uncharacterized protein n=1 Tax=Rhizophora mucronata TaxID=61149 RepID=A0A2P2IHD0_RHIMU
MGLASSQELPNPSLPFFPQPQTHNSPLDVRTTECARPPDTDTGSSPDNPSTSEGMLSGPGLPSWELWFHPHETITLASPSVSDDAVSQIAKEWPRPAATDSGRNCKSTGNSPTSSLALPT